LKKRSTNIIFSAIVCVVSLIVCIALFLPANVGNVLNINESAEAFYGVVDIQSEIGCDVASDGTYTIEGGSAINF